MLNAYPHTFSLHSVGVITDETRTLPPPLPPAERYVQKNDGYSILGPYENFLTEFMAPGTTIISEVYCEMLNKPQRSIQNKQRGMLTKGVVLLHDNMQPKPWLTQML